MNSIPLHITLSQMDEWAIKNDLQPSTKYNNIEFFISTMEICPPKQLMRKIRRLVVDEGVNPEDIITWITDEDGTPTHSYNIRLAEIFKYVYQPVEVDTSVLEQLD